MSHESDPLIGQIIGGRFKVTGVLGEGGMGVVYSGEQPMGSTVRKVAIKTLHPHLSKDPSVLARFHRECGTVAQLEHPNTIKVYDFGSTSDGTLYIAMEFVSGAALSDVIEKQGPLSPDRVVKVMRQVCGALEEAHQQGVIHRDLKPENIVLTERAGEKDFAKVLDFGIAGRTESADAQKEQKLTQQGMVLGTPPYMSPEQFTGKALDARSDVYSLAVVVYEMLTGRLPFDAETPWEWATKHLTAQPKPLEESVRANANVPEHMRQAIMKALSKNRDDRQSDVREFFQELSAGARMTVEQPVPTVDELGSAGTAAMMAVPDFSGGGIAPTAAMPQVPAAAMPMGGPARSPGVAPGFGATPPVAVPAAPAAVAPRPTKGSGKGLIIGLVGLGGVIGIVLLVFALKPKNEPDQQLALGGPLGGSTTSSPGAATIAPIATADPTPGQQGPTTGTDQSSSSGTPTTGSGGKKPASSGSGTGTTGSGTGTTGSGTGTTGSGTGTTGSGTGTTGSGTGTTGSGTGTTGSGTGTTGSGTGTTGSGTSGGGSAACEQCISAAKSGNIGGAASAYQRCGDAAKKRVCQALVRSSAPRAAKAQALNGNCAGAKAIINGAKAMGAASGSLDSALAGTSCT